MLELLFMNFSQEALVYSKAVSAITHGTSIEEYFTKGLISYWVLHHEGLYPENYQALLANNHRASLKVQTTYPDEQSFDIGIIHYRTLHRMVNEQVSSLAAVMNEIMSPRSLVFIAHKSLTIEWRWLEEKRRWWRKINGDLYFRRSNAELIDLLEPLQPVLLAQVLSEDRAIDDFDLIGCVKDSSPLTSYGISYRTFIKENPQDLNELTY